ncbi:MAG: hypothetical protein ABJC13_07145 [Acidobacteriota bacterium]
MRTPLGPLLSAIVLLLPSSAVAARFPIREPAGLIFAVDGTHDANLQPSTAFDGAGNSVAVWTRGTDLANRSEVVAQRFGPTGALRGGRFRVNTYLPDFQAYPAVTMNENGRFVVTWASFGQEGQLSGIYARVFGANGAPVSSELRVSTSLGGQSLPTVGIDRTGGFVIAWYSEKGNYLRRFDRAGGSLGPESRVSSGSNPKLAMAPDGSFILVWREFDPAAGGAIIHGRRFGRSGAAASAVLTINSRPIPNNGTPAVALTPDGGFLIAWDRCNFSDFAEGCEVRLRRYDERARPLSDDLTVSPKDHRAHEFPAVAAEPGGFSAVTWQDCSLDGGGQPYDCKIDTLFFDPSGKASPALSRITEDGDLLEPMVTAGGGFFVVSYDSTNCDAARCDYTFPTGAYALRYRIRRP